MDEIRSTPEQAERIRLMEDTDLFHAAVTFARERPRIENRQLTGLLTFSHSWKDLTDFVKHQKGRDWGEPGRSDNAHYRDFYNELDNYLHQELRLQVKNDNIFIPPDLTNKETNRLVDHFAGRLARSFIQHLVAEIRWQEVKS